MDHILDGQKSKGEVKQNKDALISQQGHSEKEAAAPKPKKESKEKEKKGKTKYRGKRGSSRETKGN